jgi:hypothetical protein
MMWTGIKVAAAFLGAIVIVGGTMQIGTAMGLDPEVATWVAAGVLLYVGSKVIG